MNGHLTKSGIPGVGMVPHDFHFCHFYPSAEELSAILIPFFEAGLANHERCIWMAAPPLPAPEVRQLIAGRPALAAAEESGRLSVVDAPDWRADVRARDVEELVGRWIEAEERALADGFRGLRTSGNAGFAPEGRWDDLMELEGTFHRRTRGRRIVTCCSYPHHPRRPLDILDVTHSHNATLARDGGSWQVFLHGDDRLRA